MFSTGVQCTRTHFSESLAFVVRCSCTQGDMKAFLLRVRWAGIVMYLVSKVGVSSWLILL